jgi:hypothetical protein
MKKRFILIILSSVLLHAGCSDWLDVRPQTEKTKDQLFETQKGFRDALVGAYIRMKGGNAYGDAMMWGTIEHMASHWDNYASGSALSYLKNLDYSNQFVQDRLAAIYQELYRVIADVNSILENIDEKEPVFEAGNYELIKGEALALRAYCHFDILRLFGPIPSIVNDEKILPYVKRVTNEIHDHLPYEAFVAEVLNDLDEAEELLEGVDPILNYSITDLNNLTSGDFTTPDSHWAYRQVRVNYYAVLALKARVYLWVAQDETKAGAARANALKYARAVIDAVDNQGVSTFRLGDASDMAREDYSMSPEHIAALSVYDLEARANSLFGPEGSLMKSDMITYYYYMAPLFPNGEQTTDIRWLLWVPRSSDVNISYRILRKFIQRSSNPVLQVPLLRLSEMYLIAIESTADLDEAAGWYRTFSIAKGMPVFTAFVDESDRRTRMIREYSREFFAEGQPFFVYKRLNVTTSFLASQPNKNGSAEAYLVPKPDREIVYNNQ